MAFKVRDIYNAVCQVLLEPSGVKLGLISENEVIKKIGETVGDLARDISLDVSMVAIQALAFENTYETPDRISIIGGVMFNESYVTPTSQFSLDNSGSGEWLTDEPGVPNAWAQDMLEPKKFICSPAPSITGLGVDAGGSGFLGTLSSTVDGSDISITAAAPYFGVLSGEYTSQIYLAEEGFHFGTFSDFVQANGNLLVFGTVLQDDPDIDYLDQFVQGIPDSFQHYVKYGTLARIFSIDGELRDMQRQRYCAARYQEGVNLGRAIRREKLLEKGGR